MERTKLLSRRLWTVAILAGFASIPVFGQISGETQFMEGQVVVKAVDDRRVLVAVDTAGEGVPPDGSVDHLYLFTSRVPVAKGIDRTGHARVEDRGHEVGYLKIEHSGHTLELVVQNDRTPGLGPVPPGTQRLSESMGLSHYWGFRASGFRMRDLQRLRVDSKCDHVPGSCYRAGDFVILFPS